MPQQQDRTTDAAKIMESIQQMLSSVGTATGATGQQAPPMVPGAAPVAPRPTISFDPRTGAPAIQTAGPVPRPSVPPTGGISVGTFPTQTAATNAGLISLGNSLSGIFSTIEQREHAKKAAMAENYLTQINGLLASGDPQDRQKAMMILEDPKIRKTLKTGLEYVPLEEEVPPEATGVKSAIQKIAGQQPQAPQRRPIIPQASQEQQLKAAMTSALLQKIKQDPASAITMMGQPQLSAAEQHASEFYKAGLGISPAEMDRMSAAEKLQGLRIFEQATSAAIRGEVDMYKAGLGYKGKVDAATILGNARKYVSDMAKKSTKDGRVNSFAAGAKIYEDYAKKYLDIIKGGKGPDGKPLSEDQIKQYQQKADSFQRQADEYLNQAGDQELMEMFMKAVEEPDTTPPEDREEEPR